MALSSADKLRGALKRKDDPEHTYVGGDPGRAAMDVGALGLMAAPSAAALHTLVRKKPVTGPLAGGGSKLVNAANLASLVALAAPGADRIQAHLRGGDDKRMLSDKAHEVLELGGLAGLSAGVAKNLHGAFKSRKEPGSNFRNALLSNGSLLSGYGVLAAPAAHGLMHPHHEGADSSPNPDAGKWKKPASELAGLGLLAAPSIASMLKGHH